MSLVLPKISRFAEKKNLACEEYDYIVFPTGGEKTFSAGERIDFIINQQTSSRLRCINGSQSYGTLQGNFANAAGAVAATGTWFLDGSANCFIDRIETNSYDGPLEDFSHSNVYIPVVYDLTTDPITRNTFFSFFGNNETAAATTANCRLGYDLAEGVDIPASETKKILFGFMLPSFLGSFSNKLFPFSEVATNSLTVTLYTDSALNALKYTVRTPTLTFDRVKLHFSVVEYNDTITSIIRGAYREMIIPCVSIKNLNTQYTIGQTRSTWEWTTSPNIANAKGVCFVFRTSLTKGVAGQYGLSSRTNAGLKNVYLQIGDTRYPSIGNLTYDGTTTRVTDGSVQYMDPNFFMYAMKYFGNGIDKHSGCSVNRSNFYTAGATAALNTGTFALCFSLEGMSSEHDDYRSCTNLIGNQMVLNFEVGTVSGNDAAAILYVDAFIMHEYDVRIADKTCVAINRINVPYVSMMTK